jgi:hypothetical protein
MPQGTLSLVTPEPKDVPPQGPTGAPRDDLSGVPERIIDSMDGPTIIYADGTVVHYRVPTKDELDEAGDSV